MIAPPLLPATVPAIVCPAASRTYPFVICIRPDGTIIIHSHNKK